jgi:(p)ppGpp synthase/HD superfamily hydrolase
MTETVASLEARERMGAGELTKRFDAALAYASAHHRTQFRKGSRVPYLSHLMSVSALVLEHGGSEDQAIAALLHDAVEDAAPGQGPTVLTDIGVRFEEPVRAMVAACSSAARSAAERPRASASARTVCG